METWKSFEKALWTAVQNRDFSEVETFIQIIRQSRKYTLMLFDGNNNNLLHLAFSEPDIPIIMKLIDVFSQTPKVLFGRTIDTQQMPIHKAIIYGYEEIVVSLLKLAETHGCLEEVFAWDIQGASLLHQAAEHGRLQILQLLIEKLKIISSSKKDLIFIITLIKQIKMAIQPYS